MSENLRKRPKLLVVSDTTIVTADDKARAYEPVVRELDAIADLFEEIIWLGYGFTEKNTPLVSPASPHIKLVPMPPSGGAGLLSKFKIIFLYPLYLLYIFKYIKGVTHVHSRAPSHPAFLAMLISKWDTRRTYWHKYAGNWIEPRPPKMYGFQKNTLATLDNKRVYGTINGYWEGQKPHLLAFENPCLFESEIKEAEKYAIEKSFDDKLSIIFIGSLSRFKGVLQLVESLEFLENPERFSDLTIIGGGELLEELKRMASMKTCIPVHVVGHLNRTQAEAFYGKAHINALPSDSEGFPKVIAEGAAYGCIPLITDVSSIGQYIHTGKNGFLIVNNSPKVIAAMLNEISNRNDLKKISKTARVLCKRFTYEYFKNRIESEIL